MTTAVAPRRVTAPAGPVTRRCPDVDMTRDEFVSQLHASYHASLLSYVLGRTGGDFHRAEDVIQETMLRAWLHADELSRRTETVGAWLRRVSRNAAIDALRARACRPPEVPSELTTGPIVSDHADGVVTAITVRQALRKLSPIHRDVLVQLYYRGHDQNEAAKALGIPVGTVKSRVHYALSALRDQLGARQPMRQAA